MKHTFQSVSQCFFFKTKLSVERPIRIPELLLPDKDTSGTLCLPHWIQNEYLSYIYIYIYVHIYPNASSVAALAVDWYGEGECLLNLNPILGTRAQPLGRKTGQKK